MLAAKGISLKDLRYQSKTVRVLLKLIVFPLTKKQRTTARKTRSQNLSVATKKKPLASRNDRYPDFLTLRSEPTKR